MSTFIKLILKTYNYGQKSRKGEIDFLFFFEGFTSLREAYCHVSAEELLNV